MNKDSDFTFIPEDNSVFPNLYGIYKKGVNCSAGKERPIGTIFISNSKFERTVRIQIHEVDLTADGYIELINEIKKQLNVCADTDIKFTA